MSARKNGVSFLSACGNAHVAVMPDLSEEHDMRLVFSWAGEKPETFFMKTDFARHLAGVLADVADGIDEDVSQYSIEAWDPVALEWSPIGNLPNSFESHDEALRFVEHWEGLQFRVVEVQE